MKVNRKRTQRQKRKHRRPEARIVALQEHIGQLRTRLACEQATADDWYRWLAATVQLRAYRRKDDEWNARYTVQRQQRVEAVMVGRGYVNADRTRAIRIREGEEDGNQSLE